MTAIESSFSVATGNKYNFLLDDVEDPEEALRLAVEQKEKPKQKSKKARPEGKQVNPTVEDKKPQSKQDVPSSMDLVSQGKKGRRDRGSQQEGKSAIPRFSSERDTEGSEQQQQQRQAGRGFSRGASRGGFGSRSRDDATPETGGEEGAPRGRGRGRGGEGRGRGRGESRGGFGARGGESRGRGVRGFGPRGGDAERPVAAEGEESMPPTSGFGRGRGGFGRGGFGNKSELADSMVEPSAEEESPDVGGEENRPRGRGRGFGRGRSGRGFGGGFSRGGRGREYERHSGAVATGVKPIEKRDGAGAHNWGTVKDDLEEQLQTEDTSVTKDQDWAEVVEQEAAAEAGTELQSEPMMTLEEWKRQKAEDRAKLEISKTGDQSRKVDMSGFKEMTAYRKERFAEDDDSEEEDESTAHIIVKKSQIETNFYYNNPQSNFDEGRRRGGRGGRGGRGRGDHSRGGGDRGGSRGRGRGGSGVGSGGSMPSANAEFRVDDKDFPDLH